MAKRYRQIPVELEAIQWNGSNIEELKEFLDGGARVYSNCLFVKTHDGERNANVTDYIAKSGTENHQIIRIIDADVFEKVYEEVDN